MGVAVKLRDEPLDMNNELPDESVSKNRMSKIPALFKVDFDSIEFQYEQPSRPSPTPSTLFQKDWLKRLKAYVWGEDGESATTTTVTEVNNGPVKFEVKLKSVQLRPSVVKNTIVLAQRLHKVGYSHKRKTQDLIRFDVDPRIGRDVLLYTSIAFQAAVSTGDVRPQKWREMAETGTLEAGKLLVQRQLEAMVSRSSAEETAYEEMPATPWDY